MKSEQLIDIHLCDQNTPSFYKEKTVIDWVDRVIREEGKETGYISFIFCDDSFLIKLNREYLQHDFYTDVITFDYSDDLGGISGDIFISVERVKENAQELGIKLSDEFYRVMVHGILHLLGYSDKEDRLRGIMQERENHYLSLVV